MKKNFLWIICMLLAVASCKKEDNNGPGEIWKDSVFVVNEGPYQNGTGTVLAYNRATGEVSGDLFEAANGRPMGNIVQSLAVHDDKVWISVNNSNKIEVVNLEDFKSVATIDNISLPRYIVFKDDKAYVSCWDNSVKIINVNSFEILDQFVTGAGSDEMAISGEYLYVINGGGYGVDSTITFVNIKNKEIFGKIEVGHRPAGIVKDKNGKLWVLCSGKGWNGFPAGDDTKGGIYCIDPGNKQIITSIEFPDAEHHPDQLIINGDGDILYYSFPNGIHSVPIVDPALSSSPLIPSTMMYYGIGYDTAKDIIFASDPLDYSQKGRVFRFDASDGTALDSFEAGVVPTGYWFN
jgi:hypothetical protein